MITLFEKSNFCPKIHFDKTPTFSRVLHPNFFWQFFSWNQSCQQLKSPKPQHFHQFFIQNKSTIFSGNQSWIFGQKFDFSNSVVPCYIELPKFLRFESLEKCLNLRSCTFKSRLFFQNRMWKVGGFASQITFGYCRGYSPSSDGHRNHFGASIIIPRKHIR